MSQRKVRQHCIPCNQITTQVKEVGVKEWKCLCCESAKFRSAKKSEQIKKKSDTKPKLNLNF